jgi:23S rRNA pseudouridine2604 synthase
MEQRINQYLAEKNIASRREADELIAKGLVWVNGKRATLGQKIDESRDTVEVKNLKKHYVYYAYNKPVGIVTTTPQQGEIDIVHHTRFPHKVFPVGRLDKDSEGLIIMTNDRRLTKKMLEPDAKVDKEYMVEIQEKVTPEFIEFLKLGVRLDDGYVTRKASASKISPKQFSIILTEGKNRQIRRMVSAYHFTVVKLKRIRIGKVHLRTLKPGAFVSIAEKDIIMSK